MKLQLLEQSTRQYTVAQLNLNSVEPDVKFGFILSPKFTLLPFAGFLDTIRHSADEGDRSRQVYCHWSILGKNLAPIQSNCGAEILPWEIYSESDKFDYIVVIGGLMSEFHQHAPETFELLRYAGQLGVPVVGLCTGCFAMAEAGLLDDKRCAVHFRHHEEFVERYPIVKVTTHEVFIFDENAITCPGGTAAIDVAVELVMRHSGKARAFKGLADMIVDEHRVANHVPRLPYEELLICGNWRVEQAVKLMQRTLEYPTSIYRLAKQLGTSVSQLDRDFSEHTNKTPASLWREMRLQHARWRLLNSNRSITEISYECGFADCAHMVRSFKYCFGETPREFRRVRAIKFEDAE